MKRFYVAFDCRIAGLCYTLAGGPILDAIRILTDACIPFLADGTALWRIG